LLRKDPEKLWRVDWIEACVEEAPWERSSLGQRIWRVVRGGT